MDPARISWRFYWLFFCRNVGVLSAVDDYPKLDPFEVLIEGKTCRSGILKPRVLKYLETSPNGELSQLFCINPFLQLLNVLRCLRRLNKYLSFKGVISEFFVLDIIAIHYNEVLSSSSHFNFYSERFFLTFEKIRSYFLLPSN